MKRRSIKADHIFEVYAMHGPDGAIYQFGVLYGSPSYFAWHGELGDPVYKIRVYLKERAA